MDLSLCRGVDVYFIFWFFIKKDNNFIGYRLNYTFDCIEFVIYYSSFEARSGLVSDYQFVETFFVCALTIYLLRLIICIVLTPS